MNLFKSISKWGFIISIVLFLTLLGFACQSSGDGFKPRPLGAPGELLVVVNPSFSESDQGELLTTLLQDTFPSLPQPEALFKKTTIAFSGFQRHFRTYRNILIVEVKPNSGTAKLELRKNEWALNQQVAKLIAEDNEAMALLLEQKWSTIKSFYYHGDIAALAGSYREVFQPEAVDAVSENHPFSMYFPRGFVVKKQTDQFSWFSFERLDNQLGVFVYRCSMDSIEGTTAHDFLHLRNAVLQQQVPGQYPGSYMTTEESYPVSVNTTTFGGLKWTELRGLWKVQGDFMGGPFVDYFYADKAKNELVMLEAYVYAPSKPNKAVFVREVEAVLKTFMPVN